MICEPTVCKPEWTPDLSAGIQRETVDELRALGKETTRPTQAWLGPS